METQVHKKSAPRFAKVIVASGHMIDAADRVAKGLSERFPPRKETVVRERIAEQLGTWKIGAGDLAICGGARGADILFAEICAERGAEVWVFQPLEDREFLDESVRLPGSDWEDRFIALRDLENVKMFLQSDLKSAANGTSVFALNNLRMIDTARAEASEPKNLYAILVWDEEPGGDGPGGTADFVASVKELGGHLAIVNPTKL